MKFLTFTIAAALVLEVIAVTERRQADMAHAAPAQSQPAAQFRNVMDLTAPASRNAAQLETRITAPARYQQGSWAVDDIPPQRLLGRLVVLDVRAKAASHPDYEVSIDDIDHWERVHGEIPPDGIVVALTGRTAADLNGVAPAYSNDAVEFLGSGRHVLALGSDGPSVTRNEAQQRFIARLGMYELSGVAGLNMVPEAGTIVVVAPARSNGATQGDARMFALLR